MQLTRIAQFSTALLVSIGAALHSARAEETPPLRFENGDVVALIGDSITRGGLYHSFIQLFYATRYPEMRPSFFNAGRSGDAAPRTLKRLGWDVLERKPTVATVMLGMNDMGGGFSEGGNRMPRSRPRCAKK